MLAVEWASLSYKLFQCLMSEKEEEEKRSWASLIPVWIYFYTYIFPSIKQIEHEYFGENRKTLFEWSPRTLYGQR